MSTNRRPLACQAPPQHILLATDLSCRCDRALDRAMWLAKLWNAHLHIVHALEEPTRSDHSNAHQSAIAERQIRLEIGRRKVAFDVLLEPGDPAEIILRTAAALETGLIVTGIARDETFGRSFLDNTVEKVVRHAPLPVLVTKTRPHGMYRRIIAATDFSTAARNALECAMALFPDAKFTLMHAFHVPFEGFSDHVDLNATRSDLIREAREFLSTIDATKVARDRIELAIEHGSPGAVLENLLARDPVDLVVLGCPEQSGLLHLLLGSMAEHLLSILKSDILVVHEPARKHSRHTNR